MMRLGLLASLLVLLTLGALGGGITIANHMGDPFDAWSFRAPIALSVLVYFAAVWLVLRPGKTHSLALILGVAIVLRVALVAGPPLLSSDIYRYVWDGRVQNAGINPYLHIPADPALASLRDTAIYPHINRADYAPTIYPPAAQVLFAAVSAISDSVIAMKIAMVAMEAVAIACLWRLLQRAGQPLSNLLIYAWNPVGLWEFAGSGHVDAAAIAFMAIALLCRAGWTSRNRSPRGLDTWAGVALGGAVLVKFLPAIIAPALWRRGSAGWRLIAGCLVCIILLYGFYIVFGDARLKVLGFLGEYGAEEGIASGSGLWLVAGLGLLMDLPVWVSQLYLAIAVSALIALGAWIAFRPRPQPGTAADIVRICSDTAVLATALTMALSPHYPWYFVWLAIPAVVAPSRTVIWLSAASILLYYAPSPNHFLWPSLVFVPALLLAWRDLRDARAPSPIPALQGSV